MRQVIIHPVACEQPGLTGYPMRALMHSDHE